VKAGHATLFALSAAMIVSCSKPAATGGAVPSTMGSMAVAPPVALAPEPNAGEARFIGRVAADLRRRFPTPAAARRAGYVRYTAEDQDGIITFTNQRWYQDDPAHPTQLWYDAHHRLIGTDFTMPVRDKTRRPNVWGLQPGRWVHFIAHVHYAVREPNGAMRYGSMFNEDYRKAGGDPNHPSAQALVNAGIAQRASDVRLVFQLPEIWIASFWVVPNPRGAFADSNPNVKPTKGEHPNAHPAQPTP